MELPHTSPSDSVDVPGVVGLRCHLGLPTSETSQELFDEMNLQRSVQAHLVKVGVA